MPEQEFNLAVEHMQQLRELRRDVSEIRTAQARQPTRDDLQSYVLREVFDLQVQELKKTDEKQQDQLNAHETHLQTSIQRTITYLGIAAGIASALYTVVRGVFFH